MAGVSAEEESERARWVVRKSELDAEFLAKAEIQSLRLNRNLGACILRHGDNQVATLLGIPGDGLELKGLSETALTPAYLQLSVLFLGIRPTGSESAIRDVLEGRYMGAPGYEGHELNEIASLFPEIRCYEVDENLEFVSDVKRLMGTVICASGYDTPLEMSSELRDAFKSIFLFSHDNFPMVLALQGLVASFWQTSFIEIYRCIEQLYPCKYMSALLKGLNESLSLEELNELVSESLSWRPREDGALEALLRLVPTKTIKQLRQALDIDVTDTDHVAKVARRLYDIRNSVVHYRGTAKSITFDEQRWEAILAPFIDSAIVLYDKLADTYFRKSFGIRS